MQLSVDEFVAETLDDYNSPTTSQFVNRINDCRQTVANLEEVSSRRLFTPVADAACEFDSSDAASELPRVFE